MRSFTDHGFIQFVSNVLTARVKGIVLTDSGLRSIDQIGYSWVERLMNLKK